MGNKITTFLFIELHTFKWEDVKESRSPPKVLHQETVLAIVTVALTQAYVMMLEMENEKSRQKPHQNCKTVSFLPRLCGAGETWKGC